MASKTLYKAKWLWQDYTGAKWQNLSWANTGDNHASYVYPQGKGSKSSYRPKSLFYHYQVSGINADNYKIDKVDFVIITGKFNKKSNPFPTVKVYYGDNNSPYRSKPIATDNAPTFLKNKYDFDSYTMQFTFKNISVSQLKNIIFEVDWGKTKISGSSTISVNRARLVVNYSKKNPKMSLYSSLNQEKIYTTNDAIPWTLTMKNTGVCGSGSVSLKIPKGLTVSSSSGGGSYNASTKTWTYSNLCNGKTVKRTFYIKSRVAGQIFNIEALNNSIHATNLNVIEQVSFAPYYAPFVPSIDPEPVRRDDEIYYTFYKETYEKEADQFFDVQIIGMKENHPHGVACFEITPSANIELNTPVRTYVELLDENNNIREVVRDATADYDDIHVAIGDNVVCFKLENPDEDFMANIRVYMYCKDSNDGTITINAGGKDFPYTFPIRPKRNNKFVFNCEFSRDKAYVQNSINIGIPEVWTIRCKSSRHNFFKEKKSDLEIIIEKLIAYIGCIPLSRGHKADVTSDVTNTLIDTRYLNRRYLGKEGNYLEKIGMTLRMPWRDVATLKGLLEMDKPIPIDTCPELPDGDPLNHRGWAELSAVKNIKKINDMLYQCEPEVDYITHKLLTKFSIEQKENLTNTTLDYYLTETHSYNSDLLERFDVSYYGFYTSLEDDFGNYMGSYEIPAGANLKFNTKEKLNDYSSYGIKYRNTLPTLMSDDYNNNWEMAVRVKDKNTGQMLFEHLYNNFRHYDYENSQVLNVADVTSKVWDGTNFNIVNFDKISLGYGDLAPLLEDKKAVTHFNSLDDTVFDADNENFEVFLLDNENKGLQNQKVKVYVNNNAGYSNAFTFMTDVFGRIIFPVNFGNGNYTIQLVFEGTDNYRPCEYTVDVTVNYEEVEIQFDYSDNVIISNVGQTYTFKAVTDNDAPLENIMVNYSFKDVGSNSYGYERTATSDSEGYITIPIDWTNGTKTLKVDMKGFVDNGYIYQPVSFEQDVHINIMKDKSLLIEADDMELLQGDKVNYYYVKVTDENANPLQKQLSFGIYNNKESYVVDAVSNDLGIANIPLYLVGGSWNIDVHFKGDETYNPPVVNRGININRFEQKETTIITENLQLNETELINGSSEYYTITLIDSDNEPVVDEPLSITVLSGEGTQYIDVVMKTDEKGKVVLPYCTHGENVTITTKYKGSTRYRKSEKTDEVTFDNIDTKTSVSFNATSTALQIRHGNGAWEDIKDASNTVDRVIINYPDDNRTSHDGIYYYISSNANTYKVTLFYKGNAQYYAHAETLTFTKTNDTRGGQYDWAELIGVEYLWEHITTTNHEKGGLNHVKVICDYELPCEMVYLGVVPNNSATCVTLEELEDNSDYIIKTMPTYFFEDGIKKTILEWDIINPIEVDASVEWEEYNSQIFIIQDINDYVVQTQLDVPPMIPAFQWRIEDTLTDVTKSSATISQTGFAYLSQTYQRMNVIATSTDAQSHDRVNEYYVMKLLNLDTLEEFYFYSYLIDNVTSSLNEFELGLGNWELYIASKDTDRFYGSYYKTTGELVTEDKYYNIDEFFYDIGNWNNMGEEEGITIDGSTISTVDSNQCIAITNEFSDSNKYTMTFNVELAGSMEGSFMIGADLQGTTRLQANSRQMTLFKDGQIVDEKRISGIEGDWKVERDGKDWRIYHNNQLTYHTTELIYNSFGLMNGIIIIRGLYVQYEPVAEITPSVQDWDGTVFGSNIDLNIKKNMLSLIDYGMLAEGDVGAGKVILKNIPLVEGEYELETDIVYNNSRFERLNDLKGLIQYRIMEDALTSNRVMDYGKLICSPVPLQNSKTKFTRMSDEGRMYYAEPSDAGAKYLCNPYINYKGGTDLKSETGISLFNLDGGFSPVFLSNGLVRAEFHRYSGYIKVSRYDDNTEDWYVCQIFHLHDEPNLEIVDSYSDDKATIRFGNTKWTMWRGRPFIRLEHENDDLRMLNLNNRVYCETADNEFNMGFVEEHDTTYSVFNPQMSIQKFERELHIGEDIRLDNFGLCLVDIFSNEYYDADHTATLTTQVTNNENAVLLNMNTTSKIAVVFPDGVYVKKPSSTFSLLIGNLIQHGVVDLKVKARGYTENGKIKETEQYQYGVWEEIKEITLGEEGEPDEIRVTFKDVPDDVKFIDFMLICTGTGADMLFNQIMLYEGDATDEDDENKLPYDTDKSLANAVRVELSFNESYYACLYDDDSPCGLAICRPNKQSFTLRTLVKSKETVLIPYMKNYSEYDDVKNIFLEYLSSKDQVINVNWKE